MGEIGLNLEILEAGWLKSRLRFWVCVVRSDLESARKKCRRIVVLEMFRNQISSTLTKLDASPIGEIYLGGVTMRW